MSSNIKEFVPVSVKILHYIRLGVSSVAHYFFVLYHGVEGEKIPIVTEGILKEPAVEIARKIRNKEITSVTIVESFIRRIKDVNPVINCFVEDRFELALKEAQEADELVHSGSKTVKELEHEKPFLGVPFTTKDCIAVKGLHQTAGVVLRKDIIADKDAVVIKLLKEKGAIVLGLTNVSELCMWWESHNHVHGRSKNPYNTTRTVGGSSGGEGGIQAAAGSCFGIGSDLGGSIRMPAHFNGIFGHKPSRFLVDTEGHHPLPSPELLISFIGIGPMVRHAVDLKPILKIISGEDYSKLNLDTPVDMTKLKVYHSFNIEAPLTDSVHPGITSAMKNVLDFFSTKFDLQSEERVINGINESMSMWLDLMTSDSPTEQLIMKKIGVRAILTEMVRNLIGLSGNTFISLLVCLFDYTGIKINSETYNQYLKDRDNLENTFKDMLGADGIYIYPTHPTTAPYHNEPIFKPLNAFYTGIINTLGFPATSIPLGLGKDGLPLSLQVVSNHNNDRLCLAVAEELDKAFGGWREPI